MESLILEGGPLVKQLRLKGYPLLNVFNNNNNSNNNNR